jgi:hypothetical protein
LANEGQLGGGVLVSCGQLWKALYFNVPTGIFYFFLNFIVVVCFYLLLTYITGNWRAAVNDSGVIIASQLKPN